MLLQPADAAHVLGLQTHQYSGFESLDKGVHVFVIGS